MIEAGDLRAAVASGLITEAQAAGLSALAEQRRAARTATEAKEEPFVLFKGFNEIFIVIGMSILFFGWSAVAAGLGADFSSLDNGATIVLSLVTLVGLWATAQYFTTKRRMIAPSNALSIMTALTAAMLGLALAGLAGIGDDRQTFAIASGVVVAVLLAHYHSFRVPFDAALIACAGFAALTSVMAAAGILKESAALPIWAVGGGAGLVSLVYGLVAFAVAMRFDMADPHRVSTRAATGFWLHVVAGPAIVNTVAANLINRDFALAQGALFVFLLLIACIAIVIDRRSFLVSGSVFAAWLAWSLFGGSPLVIFALGGGIVYLGAQWERIRHRLMTALPEFPGKDRLPPYGSPR